MANDRHDQTSWAQLTDLAKEAFERQVTLGREYADLARSSLNGEGDRSAAGRAYLSAVRRESEHYWRELSTLGVAYATDVAALGLRVGSAVAHDMRSAMAREAHPAGTGPHAPHERTQPDRPASSPDPHPAADVALHAPAGKIATGTITVANKHPRARRISLSAGPIRAASGAELDARIVVEPRQVTVPAGEESTVLLSLEVTADTFALGATYGSVIEISGGEEATVSVQITRDPG